MKYRYCSTKKVTLLYKSIIKKIGSIVFNLFRINNNLAVELVETNTLDMVTEIKKIISLIIRTIVDRI